ncbi:MAG: hypothetical protein MGG37_14620 [Trichodesmium sp. MAG_R01]|nr:hypothetical protein [Trichodesmium sp. MAG_R01]
MSISKLTAQASNPFWVRKKCHLPISLTSEVGRRCVDRESSNFKPIEASSEESNFEDMTNFIEALNDKTALSIVDYFLICAYSAQSLYGINLAFKS